MNRFVAAVVLAGAAGWAAPAVAGAPVGGRAPWRVFGEAAGAYLGGAVASAGDVNGDGYDDVLIAAPLFDPGGQPLAGRVFLYLGGPDGPRKPAAWVATGQAGDRLGNDVAGIGDVNGDGFADVAVGAPGDAFTASGRASVYLGSAAGLPSAPQWSQTSQLGSAYGAAVGPAGDVNGDGYDDLLVGAPGYSQGEEREGVAFLYLGSAAGLQSAPAWMGQDDTRFAGFGGAVHSAGDVNGDGFADVVVGAPNWGIWIGPVTMIPYGRMYVYHGSASGLSAAPARVVTPAEQGSDYGKSVGTAGDVDGDGFDDVIVGAYEWSSPSGLEQGAVFVYAGSPSGISAQPVWTALGEGDGQQLYLGWSAGTAGDVNGDGYDDVIAGMMGYPGFPPQPGVCGRVLVFHGSAQGLPSAPSWTFTGRADSCGLGWSAATAGDVDGDGCADVAAGAPLWDRPARPDAGMALVSLSPRCGR
jgi:hypothetical protein